jgi:tRNA pseudouridine38-40 synthase
MTRYKLTIEYDGTGLAGWQRQDLLPSVQSYLEQAVQKFSGQKQELVAAGRTDAGVHAFAQVAHVDIERQVNPFNIIHGINFHLLPLTEQIAVIDAEAVADDFHARFSATSRSYFYRIVNRPARLAVARNRAWHVPEPLDAEAMHKAAQILVGHHDFTSFRSSICQAKSPIKTLDMLRVERMGDEIYIHTKARSFLHHQVRNMVGTLRFIGNGKWKEKDLQEVLDAKDRKLGGENAPACGLYFVNVTY